ncbi:Triose phosphate isomerase [Enterospora canceri]|uniref:Triose phosphate isomerase n=1 Tax=Enterospora canceri TaxID=1081671 RepID=A0A1Y1SAD6_9MICR|nr:Triose phosphate isomerase [Enterospora canceri]
MSSHRKCTFTKRPILSDEKGSVQLYLAELTQEGRASGKVKILDICESIRATGKIDELLYEMESN